MGREENLQEIERLKARIQQLEEEMETPAAKNEWVPSEYYTTYHVLAGMMLGFLGAVSSLFFNVVGSILIKQHPMELVRIYLTFPLGEKALQIESGAILALGCCLYLGTGMIYGTLFHLVLSRFYNNSPVRTRFGVVSGLGIVLWLINYYGVLSWLQPMLFGGNWIVTMIPAWVAALTHLVFAWTMLLIDEWGYFDRQGHLKNK